MNLPTRGGSPTGCLVALFTAHATLFLLACGVQGPVRPPRVQRPEPVTDLTVSQHGRTLEIKFTVPRLATDGERLTKPLEIEILRATRSGPPPESAPTDELALWKRLGPDEAQQKTTGEKMEIALPLADEEFRSLQQSTLRVGVRTLTRGFRRRAVESAFSNLVQVKILDVTEAVQGLQARVEERSIELSWSPLPSPVLAYRVYRSPTGKPDSYALLAETLTPAYSDAAFEFGRSYFYRVAGIAKEGSVVAASQDSPVIEVTPQDTFPPAAPQGLTAVYTKDAVELIWNASTEPDLGGYNVYRRVGNGPESRINSEPVRTPIYRDTPITAGTEYAYRVTAFDLSGNESAPSKEAIAETR